MSLNLQCATTEYYTGDGSRVDFNIPFKLDDPSYPDSEFYVAFWSPVSGEYVIVDSEDSDYGYSTSLKGNESIVTFDKAPVANQKFMIFRLTGVSEMRATFQPGFPIKAEDLNDNFVQLARAIEDTRCIVEGITNGEVTDGDIYWRKVGGTIYSNNEWEACDCYIASAKAIEQRIQGSVSVGDEPPPAPNYQGQLWWDSSIGNMYIYYQDGNSNQWADASVSIGDAPDDGFIYGRQDKQWVIVSGGTSGGVPDVARGTNTSYVRTSGASSTDSNTWTELPDIPEAPDLSGYVQNGDNVSVLTNDAGYITSADVFSGDYNDLTNKPSIPSNTSDLTNDSGFITSGDIPAGFSGDYNDLTNKPTIPTNNNQLTNGAGYITAADIPDGFSGNYNDLTNKPTIPSSTSDLTNDSGFITSSDIPAGFSGDYNDLTNKPTIPTNNNQLTNGAGYITAADIPTSPDLTGYVQSGDNVSVLNNDAGYITAADVPAGFSGSYNDLTDKPSIPSNTSDLTNDSGFITASDIPAGFSGDYNDLTNTPSIPSNTSDLTNDSGFITSAETFSGDYNDLTNKPTIPTNNNQLTNGAGYITLAEVPAGFSGSYNDLTDKPTIPTNNNQLTNGAGYTTFAEPGIYSNSGNPTLASGVTGAEVRSLIGAGTSSFDGNYNSLSNKPTIPTLGNYANTGLYTFDGSGNFTATGNVTAYSDITLKENIKTIPNALDKISQVRGVTYKRIGIEGRQAGVIAQEVEAVLPEVVMTDEDGIKSVAYGNLVGLLIEAVKELKAEVETLKGGD